MDITIQKGIHIYDTNTETNYRILYITEKYVHLINLDKKYKCDIIRLNNESFFNKLKNNTFIIKDEPEDNRIIDIEMLEDNVITRYKRNKLIVDTINNTYGPDYTGLTYKGTKPVFEELIKTSGLTRSGLWRLIIRYLQSGCKDISLLHAVPKSRQKDTTTKKKRGRTSAIEGNNGKVITNKDKDIMNIYLKKYLNNKKLTVPKCYDDMINNHYTTKDFKDGTFILKELPPGQKPSFYQFRYYIRKNSDKQDRRATKIGKKQFINKKRLLKGTANSDVSGPGYIFEIDACELDIAAVSIIDHGKAVGSPVAYFLKDVYSKLIVGASLSYENNSIEGMTNCLASLVEDKKEVLLSVGLDFIETYNNMSINDIMPSFIKPHILRMDHGSDFISKEMQRIAKELEIELQYTPPGTGSMKGVVERSFRSFQDYFTDLTMNIGTKDYSEGKSKHNIQAKLTIEDVKRLMYNYIIEHNCTQHRSNYHLTPDMIEKNIGNIPAEVWKYGIEYIGTPPCITDKNQFLYALLKPVKASVKRNGINYKGFRYIPEQDDKYINNIMLETKNGSIKIDIRIDLRNVNKIYYIGKNNQLYSAAMVDDTNHRAYLNKTWHDIDILRKKESQLIAEKQQASDITRRVFRRNSRAIVQDAKMASKNIKVDDKNMRETRQTERSIVAQEYSFEKHFNLPIQTQEKTQSITEPIKSKVTSEEFMKEPDTEEESTKELNRIKNATKEEQEDYIFKLAKKMMENIEEEDDEYYN